MMDLNGKVALITGGASGIGKATAKLFLSLGAKVVIAAKDEAQVTAAVSELGDQAQGIVFDASSAADNTRMIAETLDTQGQLDILVPNAGVFDGFLPLEATSEELLDKIFSVNVKGYFLACKAALDALKQSKGSIVMVASTAGFYSQQGGLAYTAAKHAIIGMIREMAFELADAGIRVNGVGPGGTGTDLRNAINLGQEFGDERSLFDNPEIDGFVQATTPLGKLGTPEEVAKAIAYLASDWASHTTGHVLMVEGGYGVRGLKAPE